MQHERASYNIPSVLCKFLIHFGYQFDVVCHEIISYYFFIFLVYGGAHVFDHAIVVAKNLFMIAEQFSEVKELNEKNVLVTLN